jgi:dTDP-4-amino-4,6-dideoxygalactose transaminase
MKVPFLDLKTQYKSIKDEVNPAIQDVLDNTAYVLGKAVSDFEDNFAKVHNVKNCIGLSSGTDGNHIVLWALGIGPGDEVIIPANTFIATAWGATLCGAKPVFVDCEAESYNIDPKKVEDAITKKTKAIVAVHLYGQSADLDPLREIARRHNIYLVEDAAQAHLAEYKGNKVGGLTEAASFSFYPGKNLGAYGEGGAVTTNNEEIAKKAKMLRDHGALQKYDHETFGHNYRMEGIQGAVLNVKLKHLSEWTNCRRKVAKQYNEMLSGTEEIILPKEMPYAKHVYHLFVIKVRSQESGVRTQSRDELQKYLGENGIATGLHYPIPLHLQKCFKDLGYKKGDFPFSEEIAELGLSLPIYPELTGAQIEYVTDHIKKFLKSK